MAASAEEISKFVIAIETNLDGLKKGLTESEKELTETKKKVTKKDDKKSFLGQMLENDQKSIASVSKSLGLLTTAFVVLSLVSASAMATLNYGKEVNSIRQVADMVNLSTRELNALIAAANSFDVDNNELLNFLNQLETARANFKIGVDMGMFKDLGLMGADIDAIVHAEDAQEALFRLADAMKRLDKDKRLYIQSKLGISPAMLDFLTQGGDYVRKSTESFYNMRPELDNIAKSTKEFIKVWTELKETFKGDIIDPIMRDSIVLLTEMFKGAKSLLDYISSYKPSAPENYTMSFGSADPSGGNMRFGSPDIWSNAAKEAVDIWNSVKDYFSNPDTSSAGGAGYTLNGVPVANPDTNVTVNVYVDGKQINANSVATIKSANETARQNAATSEVR